MKKIICMVAVVAILAVAGLATVHANGGYQGLETPADWKRDEDFNFMPFCNSHWTDANGHHRKCAYWKDYVYYLEDEIANLGNSGQILAQMQDSYNVLAGQYNASLAEVAELKKQLDAKKAKIAQLKNDLATKTSQITNLTDNLRFVQSQKESLETDLAQVKARLTEITAERDTLQTNLNNAAVAFQTLRDRASQIFAELNAEKAKVSDLTAQVTSKDARISELEADLDDAEHERDLWEDAQTRSLADLNAYRTMLKERFQGCELRYDNESPDYSVIYTHGSAADGSDDQACLDIGYESGIDNAAKHVDLRDESLSKVAFTWAVSSHYVDFNYRQIDVDGNVQFEIGGQYVPSSDTYELDSITLYKFVSTGECHLINNVLSCGRLDGSDANLTLTAAQYRNLTDIALEGVAEARKQESIFNGTSND